MLTKNRRAETPIIGMSKIGSDDKWAVNIANSQFIPSSTSQCIYNFASSFGAVGTVVDLTKLLLYNIQRRAT